MVTSWEDLRITEHDLYLFKEGRWFLSYEKLGAHACVYQGEEGYGFNLWAPGVKSVSVVGEFNSWDRSTHPLVEQEGGMWSLFVPGVPAGALYKYVIETAKGELLYKADPYARYAELIPGTASRTFDDSGYSWKDAAQQKKLTTHNFMAEPLNIFEVHLGSWKRHADGLRGNGEFAPEGDAGSYFSYRELAKELVAYVKEMGYSHIELMPVMEHPFDGSWGYQITGYFAPTSRFGTPEDFKYFIDACHKANIGVILDWVPGGFCRDEQGLVSFVGHKLYESDEHPNWGTYKFDLSRGEVRSFLISNLLYWIKEFHADGIRMDGVTSMLYLNFGIDDPAKKKFNEKGSEEDFAAIHFIRECNETVGKLCPGVMMIAEESTAWPLVTYPAADGGLGFHFKWDMGWMNDTLHYCQTDFPFRPGNHRLLTFSTMYQFNENFILPLSHDEVVHGKCSLITRMPGDYWRQFAGMRALAFYQMCHAGAKLNFMGNEIAQFIEWRYYEGIEYFLAEDYESHAAQQLYIKQLNDFYNKMPALWQKSFTSDGFEWIDADNADQSVISFIRKGERAEDTLVCIVNFDVAAREDFRVGLPMPGIWQEAFNSDAEKFGGSGVCNGRSWLKSEEISWNGRDNSVALRLPPLAGLVLKYLGPLPEKKKAGSKKVKDVEPHKSSSRKKKRK